MKKVLYTAALAALVMATGCKKSDSVTTKTYVCTCKNFYAHSGEFTGTKTTSNITSDNAADAEIKCSNNDYYTEYAYKICTITDVY